MRTREKNRHGFTLLELVVVVALMGVATTLGGQMLVRIMDGWQRVSTRAELDKTADGVFARMERDFADLLSAKGTGVSLVGITQNTEPGEDASSSPAMPDDLLVLKIRTSTGPTQPASGATVMYRVESSEERRLLVQTIGDLATDMPIGGRVELAPNADVDGMRVEYATKDGQWLDTTESEGWFDIENLPSAVRVSLTLVSADRPLNQVTRSKVFPIHVD